MEFKVLKNSFIRNKSHHRTIHFAALGLFIFLYQSSTLELSCFFFAFTNGGHLKIIAQRIHGFCAHAIQPHRFLKSFAVEFCAGIHFAHHIHHFSQRNAAAIIPNRHLFPLNHDFNCFSMAHRVFINAVVHHFFHQHINTVVGAAAIAQFADVHAGPQANMLFPVKRFDGFFGIIKKVGLFCFCHCFIARAYSGLAFGKVEAISPLDFYFSVPSVRFSV